MRRSPLRSLVRSGRSTSGRDGSKRVLIARSELRVVFCADFTAGSALFPSRLAAQSERVGSTPAAPAASRGTGPRRPKNRQAAEAHPRACCLLSGWSVHGATRGAASLRANDQLPCIQLLSSGRLRARAPTHRTARTLTMPRFAPYRSSQHDHRPRARPEHALRPFDHRRPPHGGTANARLPRWPRSGARPGARRRARDEGERRGALRPSVHTPRTHQCTSLVFS